MQCMQVKHLTSGTKCIKQRPSSPSNMVSSLKKSVSSGYGGSQGDSSDNAADVIVQGNNFCSNNSISICALRINPLYLEDNKYWSHQNISHPHSKCIKQRPSSPSNMVSSLKKSVSSGYGGSQGDSSNCPNDVKLQEDAATILEQNGNYVRSLKIATQERNRRRVSRFSSSYMSGSSVAGTLTTIPEGKVDSIIPKPIWPKVDLHNDTCDSLVDETMLLYTSSSLTHSRGIHLAAGEQSVKDILIDLLNGIDATIQGKGSTAEEMLKRVNEKILLSIEVLKNCTEEEMRKLCVSLSNSKNVLSVIRAFGNSSSNSTSGNSTQSCPEWSSGREQPVCSETDDIYQIPSASSSSGFSDSFKQLDINQLPVFVHEDISNVPNGLRNAMIYGTLYRGNYKPSPEKDKWAIKQKKGLLQACNDNKPSVWEQYYGVNILPDGMKMAYSSNPTDIPLYDTPKSVEIPIRSPVLVNINTINKVTLQNKDNYDNKENFTPLDFETLNNLSVESQWTTELGSLALKDLNEKAAVKPKLLPVTEDIVKLKNFAEQSAEESYELLKSTKSIPAYKTLAETTLVLTILHNRKRVGDIQYLELNCYSEQINNNTNGTVQTEMATSLTENEKILTQHYKRIVSIGKGSRAVTILIPKNAKVLHDDIQSQSNEIEQLAKFMGHYYITT
ncbi:hypothetical protein MML48_2g00000898 [Holotrichia oblita]|uniref:Uncharacterized protein n=1 Tax=Holotrichia oblita TaxID=644536 RepID=A0ACB9TMH6_HOLOL|nr:hypothetical protein MML48_2g00000898 [Holotrichia oblita]